MSSPHLFRKVFVKYTLRRVFDVAILLLLLSLCFYRLFFLCRPVTPGLPWLLAFLCESWFTFTWFLVVNIKWSPLKYTTYPQNLNQRFPDLPRVDMFVTTADPVLEPPIILINTVLSLLAVDYPSDKLACYVSDDGCSPITYYSLLQASKFAKIWVPFCKKYKVQVRAPFKYFSVQPVFSNHSPDFRLQWMNIKEEYEKLSEKIQDAVKVKIPIDLDFFTGVERGNHPTIIKIIWENKELGNDGVPHIVYIAREKRPKHPHHYKAGAMNVLTRVSGLMTNAPFMLNVDCDMFVNNPDVVRHAMCLLLGTNNEKDSAFVQFPQFFYDTLKDDPYGNQLVVTIKYILPGLSGIQGVYYCGSGCFHRRKVIYGLELDTVKLSDTTNGFIKECGNSKELKESIVDERKCPKYPSNVEAAAYQVASCTYENTTGWGNKFGWMYGSTTEDLLTGMTIHNKGYTTTYLTPDPPAFYGCSPSGGPEAMTQQKRWVTGMLEILFGRKTSPFLMFLTTKLKFRQFLAYLWVFCWGLRSIPELCYSLLPAYCIITNSIFLPKVNDPMAILPVAILVLYFGYTVTEYLKTGLTVKAWWNNQRMARINTVNPWLFGVLAVLLKLLGLSETVFEVTKKDQGNEGGGDGSEANTGFTFDESPMFLPGTVVVLVNAVAMAVVLLGLRSEHGVGTLSMEVWSSVGVMVCFGPFLNGLFRKGRYGIPSSSILKSGAFALAFVSSVWAYTVEAQMGATLPT